jgi:hypothetical protein
MSLINVSGFEQNNIVTSLAQINLKLNVNCSQILKNIQARIFTEGKQLLLFDKGREHV